MSFQVDYIDIDEQNNHEIKMNAESYHMKLECKIVPFKVNDLIDSLR
jgi:hypothetical protein